ncbi:T-cell receptor gamma chain C region 5/10-13, partial [Heterocephalus glaber]
KDFNGDISPRTTIFLPSVAETNLHKAGTYLCLLGNCFPDIVKVYLKEKDGNMVLESHQGDAMRTNDTHMKFNWLTVTGDPMDEEHKCIITHQNNKGEVDQEILFPPIGKGITDYSLLLFLLGGTDISPTEADLKEENGFLHLQLTSPSAYYTYLLLLLKSALYGAPLT